MRLVRHGTSSDQVVLHSARDAYEFLRDLSGLDREVFYRVDLNQRHGVIGCEEVSRGTLASALVHPREVYKGAILNSAASIVVAHNHPSGDPAPSEEDNRLTDRLHRAGELLGIPLLDHIIIGDGRFSSASEGA